MKFFSIDLLIVSPELSAVSLHYQAAAKVFAVGILRGVEAAGKRGQNINDIAAGESPVAPKFPPRNPAQAGTNRTQRPFAAAC